MIYSDNKEITNLANLVYNITSNDFRVPIDKFPDLFYLNVKDDNNFMNKMKKYKPDLASNIYEIESWLKSVKLIKNSFDIKDYSAKIEESEKILKTIKGDSPYYNPTYNIILIPSDSINVGSILGEEIFHFFNCYFNKNEKSIDEQEFFGFVGQNILGYLLNFHSVNEYNKMFKIFNTEKELKCIKTDNIIEQDFNDHIIEYNKANDVFKKLNHNYLPLVFLILNDPKSFFNMTSKEIKNRL